MLHPSNHLDIATVEAFKLDDFDPAAVTNAFNGLFFIGVRNEPYTSHLKIYSFLQRQPRRWLRLLPTLQKLPRLRLNLRQLLTLHVPLVSLFSCLKRYVWPRMALFLSRAFGCTCLLFTSPTIWTQSNGCTNNYYMMTQLVSFVSYFAFVPYRLSLMCMKERISCLPV